MKIKSLFPLAWIALFLLLIEPAWAQEPQKNEVFGGFTYSRIAGSDWLGWRMSYARFQSSGFGFAVDFSRIHTSVNEPYGFSYNLKEHAYILMGGVRLAAVERKKFIPFGHLLVGGARTHYEYRSSDPGSGFLIDSFSELGFALSAGGGLDLKLKGPVDWRLFGIDYIGFNSEGSWVRGFRLTSGLVFRFGKT